MIKNYFKVTLRNLIKNKWFSLINVIGLTTGIASSLITYLYISQEISYDKFHGDADRIYRVTRSTKSASGIDREPSVPYPMISSLNQDYEIFESATQIHLDDRPLVIVGDEKYIMEEAIFADSSFFDLFDYNVLSGNPKKQLAKPNLAFLSESMAKKLFKDTDPVGQKIKVRNRVEVEVAGLIEDVPPNSSLQFDLVVSYPTFSTEYLGLDVSSWEMSAEGYAYVKLRDGIKPDLAEREISEVMKKYYSEERWSRSSFQLQALTDIHLHPVKARGNSQITTLWALGVIGLFILIVGCVNFINLSTALSVKKSKEVGVRKTLGASRSQLIRQYMGDTFLVTLVSGLLSVAIAERLVPIFNQFFDKKLEMNILEDGHVLLFVLGIIVLVTLIAGTYPALILSGFNPTKALKNNIHSQSASSLFMRKVLIVVQFFISQVLIIATIVIASQMDYFISKPLGFDRETIINVSFDKNDKETLQRFRDQLLADPAVRNVSFALGAPIANNTFETHYFLTSAGKDSRREVQIKPVDRHYLDTYGLKLKYGRWFLPSEDDVVREILDSNTDSISNPEEFPYILNETAVKKLGFNDPEEAIGQNITSGIGGFSAPILGVVEDFHSNSLHSQLEPVIITHFPQFYYNAGIKISTGNTKEALAHIEKVHQNLFPENIFEYEFMDEAIADFYTQEQQTFNLFKIFACISIFISCLGLLGMIAFIVNQRTKEVGVRKVLGASTSNIIVLFSKDFMLLVLMAFVVSAPVSWYAMNMWLSDFAYRIDLEPWFFGLAIIISAAITFLTIGYQSFKAAIDNPVNALRDE